MDTSSSFRTTAFIGVLLACAAIAFAGWQFGYKAGISARTSGLFALPGDIRVLSGTVVAVGESSLSVRPFSSSGDSAKPVNVLVGESTVIEALTYKQPETMRKEQAAFDEALKRMVPGTPPPIPPEPFAREKLALKEIKAGDRVVINAEENILGKTEFIASRIGVEPAIAPPPSPQDSTTTPLAP